ncbi:hypothetical protein BLAHAN_04632 [Blautia hansenii DSM 20583]|uniref:Uncharacterized protein n=1 Tax=Blautia hansenii DSM 20583 TaxID=537007 RepID=C9L5H5_BLAHA|nr:hypothetical protein BLAHAN_04632 [Blautia hansenii DSM 20583]
MFFFLYYKPEGKIFQLLVMIKLKIFRVALRRSIVIIIEAIRRRQRILQIELFLLF